MLEGLRGEQSVAELCRREGLAPNLYYRWSKEFLEAGKKRLLGDTTREAITRFADEYGAKYTKAVTTLEQDADVLLTFFDFPAAHWKHLRTSNVIESPFATVRLRQRVTKGAGSRTKGLLMVYKLLDMAQARWRRLDGAHLLPLVRADVRFTNGVRVERQPKDRRNNAA